MAYDSENVFAQILRGKIPSEKVYEDEFSYAFKDIHPQAPVHLLVIPKGPYTDFDDFVLNAPEKEKEGYFKAISTVAHQAGLKEKGYRLLFNIGKDSGQAVPHLHAHILAGRAFSDKIV